DPESCARIIRDVVPSGIVNAAAWTAVDAAEDHREAVQLINAVSPGVMAREASRLEIPFLHISTDYVFDGSGSTPFSPEDVPRPKSVYGQTKREGELSVEAAGGVSAILRTSWVFSAHGSNFVKTMLRLSETRDHLSVVGDQTGGPTPARDIAKACVVVLEGLAKDPASAGTYHFSGAPDVSWAEFAREIFRQAGRSVQIEDIPTAQFPTPAPRPANSRLNCTATQSVFRLDRPNWKAGLKEVLERLKIR
ncbi:MAG: dTDP-4-dehydrorhamnose reductase, partial [Litoreibacter sp.]|nr:dTDP-4-dehydrorhamnose reductase [Litoreibacter sp.]